MEAHQKIKMIRKTLGLSHRSIIEIYDVNLCWFWYGKGEMFCK